MFTMWKESMKAHVAKRRLFYWEAARAALNSAPLNAINRILDSHNDSTRSTKVSAQNSTYWKGTASKVANSIAMVTCAALDVFQSGNYVTVRRKWTAMDYKLPHYSTAHCALFTHLEMSELRLHATHLISSGLMECEFRFSSVTVPMHIFCLVIRAVEFWLHDTRNVTIQLQLLKFH
jgi:hypothetical protein